ncbi:helix-turn-helix domain-containing protein [Neobacillus sp. NPDC093127]|uniref:AlbA family DNA-binding domain-containing protein n=1 Tax=Neobacillus sp. NPDC093127 TaxID=3364296 RepID=UPI0037FA18AB
MNNAFKDIGANAELVKDIIAFANNGFKKSYLVIGVADNKRGFRSVENHKLTELNIQSLVKDSIFPAPRVTVFDQGWSYNGIEPEHKDKRFVII